MSTIALELLRFLKASGAREVFGIPGDFALPFFKVIEESAVLPLYTLSHEPAVGFAADAAARMHGGLGVAAVTYGAGALNMVNPVACAYSEKSPLVVISGAPGLGERGGGLLLHHQAKQLDSQLRVYGEITCDQAVLDDPRRAAADIARVVRSCLEQARPVYIELPRDLVHAPCGRIAPAPPSQSDDEAVAACAASILKKVSRARSPVLMVGVEVRRFGLEAKVADLADRLGIPVVTTFMGRGLLASAKSLVGTYIGLAGRQEIRDLVEDADLLLMLGVILADTNFGVSGNQIDLRRSILAADRAVRMDYAIYPDLPLDRLVDAMLRAAPSGPAKAQDAVVVPPGGVVADDGPIEPMDIARAVNDLFDAHGVMPIAADIGDCLFTAMDIVPTRLVAPGYYATMGFGVPAGLGVQAASGERPLILVGDGAFQMTGWELRHAARFGWDPIVLVFNNASWEMLRTFQPETGYNNLDDWGFAAIAEALGGDGQRVSTRRELVSALSSAHARRGRFQLIEVMLARGAISDTLARFVAAIKGRNQPATAKTGS